MTSIYWQAYQLLDCDSLTEEDRSTLFKLMYEIDEVESLTGTLCFESNAELSEIVQTLTQQVLTNLSKFRYRAWKYDGLGKSVVSAPHIQELADKHQVMISVITRWRGKSAQFYAVPSHQDDLQFLSRLHAFITELTEHYNVKSVDFPNLNE